MKQMRAKEDRVMKLISVIMSTFLLLTGCNSPKTPGVAQLKPETATLAPRPTSSKATEPTGVVQTKVAIPAPPTTKLVTLGEKGDRSWGRPVDPLSLLDLPGYQAIDFGHHYTRALSHDGRTLAMITWPNGMDNLGGVLHLVEMPAWTDHVTDVTFNYFVGTLLFSPDGKKLYWYAPTRTDPTHGLPRDYKLYRYDLGSEVLTEVMQFPTSFEPWEMHLLDAGSRMAIYGLPTNPENLVGDVPHVLLVDLDTGRLTADVRLEGVAAGQMRVDTTGTNEIPYRSFRPGLAWDVGRSLLYVVHADSDRITVVDLAKGKVRQQADIRPAQSSLELLLGWLATPAQAKVVAGTEKWATLDPEGKRLYVVGLRSEFERKQDSQEWTSRQIPLGLQVIATDDLTVQQRLDLAVNDLAFSPDGKWLLLTSAYDVTGADGQLERVTGGVYLVDANTLQVADHLLPDSEVWLHGFSADGRYGYVSTATSEWLGDHWGNWRENLHLLDLESGRFVAEREFPGYFLDIFQ